ncbi:unnamed protein product [Macrosiphum euphorbiae]|uniref:Uncharacterized protein n=1 Tax=Macrosiphum euphorbiae TaxID=13131 RepID=A0AAV0X091_9HEMI|nr:unnamed protein product [Macrosiphum euphorbiae]
MSGTNNYLFYPETWIKGRFWGPPISKGEGATPENSRIGEERRRRPRTGNNDGRSIRWSRVPGTGPKNRDHEDGGQQRFPPRDAAGRQSTATVTGRHDSGPGLDEFPVPDRVRKLRKNRCTYHGTAEH